MTHCAIKWPIDGATCLFTFDTGIQKTILTARYYSGHLSDFLTESAIRRNLAGIGGARSVPTYIAKSLSIDLSGGNTLLRDVPVLAERVGKHFDDFCGNLGLDAVQEFSAFALDFRNMRFDVR